MSQRAFARDSPDLLAETAVVVQSIVREPTGVILHAVDLDERNRTRGRVTPDPVLVRVANQDGPHLRISPDQFKESKRVFRENSDPIRKGVAELRRNRLMVRQEQRRNSQFAGFFQFPLQLAHSQVGKDPMMFSGLDRIEQQ